MKLYFSKKAVKFLKKLDKEQSRWINIKIKDLLNNPVPSDSKTLSGYKELIFRIRIDDFRVLYEVDHNSNVIGIIKIDKRERVY